jgi:hypothetical protein
VRRQTLSRGASRNLNNIGRLHDIVSTLKELILRGYL